MVVIYEVNLEINKEVTEAYMAWLVPHIGQMLEFPGFLDCQINQFERVKDENSPNTDRFVVTYKVKDRESLEEYFRNGATKMRSDGVNRFKGQFKAWRRVITPKQSFSKL